MTVADLLQNAAGNLWRMKLRAILTISGVLIAISAFVSMLSFGAGMQKTISEGFEELGLFNTMYVYPSSSRQARAAQRERDEKDKSLVSKDSSDTLADSLIDSTSDTLQESRVDSTTDSTADTTADSTTTPKEKESRLLDSAAVNFLATIPGVNLAYPYENLTVKVQLRDTSFQTRARAVPVSATKTKLFSKFLAGEAYKTDSAHQVMVTNRFLSEIGINFDSAETLIGDTIIVSVEVASIDSAISSLLFDKNFDSIKAHFKDLSFDSLKNPEYRTRLFQSELSGSLQRFIDGYLNIREPIADTMIIIGVIDAGRSGGLIRELALPISTGEKLSNAGFSGSQQELFTSLASGNLPGFGGAKDSSKEFSRVTLDLDKSVPYGSIKDSVEALGFGTFSFAEEFTEIQTVFLFFNMALGLIGLIALVTAGLGIVNTMVMSILERRKEIGVLKSLGADDSDIKLMYLFESGMIGIAGAIGGIAVGWLITQGVALIADYYMRSKDIPPMDFFALPIWLIAIAIAIGLTISVIAGFYPASRAAKVDPVQALRND